MSVPVYVILGHQDEHLGLMIAMEEMKLFDKGEVTIIPPNLFNYVAIIIIIIIIIMNLKHAQVNFPGICQAGILFYIYVGVGVGVCIYVYTECPRRNVPDFGRAFLTLKYTDITQNTYLQS